MEQEEYRNGGAGWWSKMVDQQKDENGGAGGLCACRCNTVTGEHPDEHRVELRARYDAIPVPGLYNNLTTCTVPDL